MENNPNVAPFKVDSDKPERLFEVQENGDVLMHETSKSKVWFHAREFLSFYREHIKDKELLEKSIEEESINKVKKDINLLKADITFMDIYIKDSEKKYIVDNKKKMLEQRTKALKGYLSEPKDKRNESLIMAIWGSIKEKEEKDIIMKELSDEERKVLIDIKARAKRVKK